MTIETTLYAFIIVSIIMNLIMFSIWSKSSWLNVFVKFVFLLLSVFGIVLAILLYPIYF